MGRNWSIEEQVYVQPDVKLRFEFTSEHTEAVGHGRDAPVHDKWLMLNVYNESGTRVIRINFTRAGQVISSEIENIGEGDEVPLTDTERLAAQVREAERTAEPTAAELGAAARAAGEEPLVRVPRFEGETTQEQAWAGINLASKFSGDI
jgi:hypothetical protein